MPLHLRVGLCTGQAVRGFLGAIADVTTHPALRLRLNLGDYPKGVDVVCAAYAQWHSLAKTTGSRYVNNTIDWFLDAWMIYLMGKQLSINEHPKEIPLAVSSQ